MVTEIAKRLEALVQKVHSELGLWLKALGCYYPVWSIDELFKLTFLKLLMWKLVILLAFTLAPRR